ncbi:MAG: hypothetical protein GY696_25265 [Gammaproteobacteria bacterium]|nr:hypothetical protein [Gammaproteobacteria bacterium]
MCKHEKSSMVDMDVVEEGEIVSRIYPKIPDPPHTILPEVAPRASLHLPGLSDSLRDTHIQERGQVLRADVI